MLERLPPIPRKMYALLADGQAHGAHELHALLNDTLAPLHNIAGHLTLLRRELRHVGQALSMERYQGNTYYRLTRIIQSDRMSSTTIDHV